MVKTVFELDLWLKNYSKKTKITMCLYDAKIQISITSAWGYLAGPLNISILVPVGFYAQKYFYARISMFLCSCPYANLSMIMSLCFYALANLWTKNFKKKIFTMDLKLCIKNSRNLVVKTVFELDLWLKNYSEKTKIKWWVCKHACLRCMGGRRPLCWLSHRRFL